MSIVTEADERYGGAAPTDKKLIKLGKPEPKYHYRWRIRRRWICDKFYFSLERCERWFWFDLEIVNVGEYNRMIKPIQKFQTCRLDSLQFGDARTVWFASEEDARAAIGMYEKSYRLELERGGETLIYVNQN